MPPENKDPQPIDPKSLLLPKKEGAPSPDTVQRINAAALVAQEESATLLKPEGPKPEPANGLAQGLAVTASGDRAAGQTEDPRGPLTEQVSAPVTPSAVPDSAPATPMPAAETSAVTPLQTYKSDIEKVVTDKNVSVLDIASAEANRRAEEGTAPTQEGIMWRTYGMYAGAALLVATALGVGALVFLRDTSLPKAPELQAPYIAVDSYQLLDVPAEANRDSLSDSLQIARQNSKLSLGLVDWLYLARPGEGAPQPLPTLDFLTTLTPNVPPALQRTLGPTFLLGLHSFDENQPFLLLQADTYTTAYAAMLEWERTMRGDLGPLFVRNPSPKIPAPAAPAEQLGSTTLQVEQQPVFIPTSFVDKIVENRDTRALLSAEGDILLLWTMLGRNIILITTNEYTLREVVSRIHVAPTIPQPGQ